VQRKILIFLAMVSFSFVVPVANAKQKRNAYIANAMSVAGKLYDIHNSHFSGPIEAYGKFVRRFNNKDVIVIENEKGEIVGYASVTTRTGKGRGEASNIAFINELFVHAESEGRQYGTDLVPAVVELIECDKVAVALADSDRDAIDFSLRLGFEPGKSKDQKIVSSSVREKKYVYVAEVDALDESLPENVKVKTGKAKDPATGMEREVPIVTFANANENVSVVEPAVQKPAKVATRKKTVVRPAAANIEEVRRTFPEPRPAYEPRVAADRYVPPPQKREPDTIEKVDKWFERNMDSAAGVYIAPAAACYALVSHFFRK